MTRKIAIDIGGTMTSSLKARDLGNGEFLYPPPFEGCLEVIGDLAAEYGGHNLYIISKATGDARIAANIELLRRWNFLERVGMPPENVFIYDGKKFGRDEKARYVADNGITDMIDDAPEVFADLPPTVRCFIFNPDAEELAEYAPKLAGRHLTIVRDWADFYRHFWI